MPACARSRSRSSAGRRCSRSWTSPSRSRATGEVLIEVARAGMNFGDTHQRENSYLARVRAAADPRRRGGGHDPRTGSAWSRWSHAAATPSTGVAPEATIFPIPDGLDDDAALALLIQGLTAWHLYRTSREAARGRDRRRPSRAPAASAASRVQLAKPFGAGRVIATASTEEKRAPRSSSEPTPRSRRTDDLKDALIEANGGTRWTSCSRCPAEASSSSPPALAPFGRSSPTGSRREQNTARHRPVMRKSRGVVGFWLMHCLERPEMLVEPIASCSSAARGELKPVVGRDLSARRGRARRTRISWRAASPGKLLLDPSR